MKRFFKWIASLGKDKKSVPVKQEKKKLFNFPKVEPERDYEAEAKILQVAFDDILAENKKLKQQVAIYKEFDPFLRQNGLIK